MDVCQSVDYDYNESKPNIQTKTIFGINELRFVKRIARMSLKLSDNLKIKIFADGANKETMLEMYQKNILKV